MPYRSVLLKLSGEALAGTQPHGIDPHMLQQYVADIRQLHAQGMRIAIVLGGGNFWRGQNAGTLGLQPAPAHYMGMLATTINSLALQDALQQQGLTTHLMSHLPIGPICHPYHRLEAQRHLHKQDIVLLSAGLGKPYFTTDTGASWAAIDLGVDLLVKGTQVDGVYTHDPKEHPEAKRYTELSLAEAIAHKLGIMDAPALALCQAHRMPILVYNATKPQRLLQALDNPQAAATLLYPQA